MEIVKSNKKGVSTLAVILSIAVATTLTYIIIKRKSPKVDVVAPSLEKTSTWMQQVNSLMNRKKSGKLLTKDKRGVPVVFEWEKVLCKEQGFGNNMKALSDLLSMLFSDMNLERLRKYPEHADAIIKFFAKEKGELRSLIQEGIIRENPEKGGTLEIANYDLYKQRMIKQIKSMVDTVETTHETFRIKDEDILIFVKVKDAGTKELIGCAIFWINDDCEDGHVIIWNMALKPKSQGRGLGKLLASSIFKILPDIKTIGLGVYSTNKGAIGAYKAWGFVEEKEPTELEEFRDLRMDYFAEQSDKLQKAAENLRVIE